MEWILDVFSFDGTFMEFFYALGAIIFIDLILAGDNAIVIGMAARNLPKNRQKTVILLGTSGAVLIRIVATILVVWLLNVPWLMLCGGLLLIWIAYKLLVQEDEHDVKAGKSVWEAVRTIIIADAAMGIDNVMAIAGVATGTSGSGHANTGLVILGLLISVPIIVWGSTLFVKVINRFPIILYFGAGVLAYTAAKMITHEKNLEAFFNSSFVFNFGFTESAAEGFTGGVTLSLAIKWIIIALVIAGVIIAGVLTNRLKEKRSKEAAPELTAGA